MNEVVKNQLRYLGFDVIGRDWDEIMKDAAHKKPSYQGFLQSVVEREFLARTEKARQARIKRAKIPELCLLETFPFNRQPKLDRKRIQELHDDLQFVREKEDLVLIGPTGCGKTGLATSFLIQAINNGYRGLFIDFNQLITKLHQSRGDRSETRLLKKLTGVDLLLIDELGYISCDREQSSLFFDLMRRRARKTTTIITTQLGFDEWGSFLHNTHITAALLDRITVNCNVFNMKQCISIRPKKIRNMTATEKT